MNFHLGWPILRGELLVSGRVLDFARIWPSQSTHRFEWEPKVRRSKVKEGFLRLVLFSWNLRKKLWFIPMFFYQSNHNYHNLLQKIGESNHILFGFCKSMDCDQENNSHFHRCHLDRDRPIHPFIITCFFFKMEHGSRSIIKSSLSPWSAGQFGRGSQGFDLSIRIHSRFWLGKWMGFNLGENISAIFL